MTWWTFLRPSGAFGGQAEADDQPRPPRRGWTVHAMDRRGDHLRERPDVKAGRWTSDAALEQAADLAAIDIDHAHQHGHQAIAIEHVRKAIEANLILAGVDLDGLVAAEARATGVPVRDLATAIARKDRAAIRPAIKRRAAKAASRGKPLA